jgi:hypothetical protein
MGRMMIRCRRPHIISPPLVSSGSSFCRSSKGTRDATQRLGRQADLRLAKAEQAFEQSLRAPILDELDYELGDGESLDAMSFCLYLAPVTQLLVFFAPVQEPFCTSSASWVSSTKFFSSSRETY